MKTVHILIFLLVGFLLAGCGTACNYEPPPPNAIGKRTKIEAKLGDKDLSFDVESAYADWGKAFGELYIGLNNHTLKKKPKDLGEIESLHSDGQIRFRLGLTGFSSSSPPKPGEYSGDRVRWADLKFRENGDVNLSGHHDMKGKVIIKSFTDSEVTGLVDLTSSNNLQIKGGFVAKRLR